VKDRGTHGHLPSRPGLEASFIAVGNGIAPGKKLVKIRTYDRRGRGFKLGH
jgi:hypothetical protein